MCFSQIINHEIKRRVTSRYLRLFHQKQVRATPHLIHRHVRTFKYWTHANGAHETTGLFHPVGLKNHVGYSHWRARTFHHFLGAQRLSSPENLP
jgi:hypothetical protein